MRGTSLRASRWRGVGLLLRRCELLGTSARRRRDEEEGSSVEEEADEVDADGELYLPAQDNLGQDEESHPPSYTQQHKEGITAHDYGANGYQVRP